MSDQETRERKYWETAPELPPDVFEAWRKPNRALSPVAIVATVDADVEVIRQSGNQSTSQSGN